MLCILTSKSWWIYFFWSFSTFFVYFYNFSAFFKIKHSTSFLLQTYLAANTVIIAPGKSCVFCGKFVTFLHFSTFLAYKRWWEYTTPGTSPVANHRANHWAMLTWLQFGCPVFGSTLYTKMEQETPRVTINFWAKPSFVYLHFSCKSLLHSLFDSSNLAFFLK